MEELRIHPSDDKKAVYESLIPQLHALIEPDLPAVTNLSNIIAALQQTFHWWWTGIYLVHQNELILGPFQGPIACTRIAKGKGVCGTAWEKGEVILVPDVEAFPGHIACSAASKSEIVLPLVVNNTVVGVFDIDSEFLNHFDETDREYLIRIAAIMAPPADQLARSFN